ncbi:MAG TPA: DUF1700 domain-containing protein [Gaiellaceae bacterium]|jgi:uncharacterized membrane protein
MNAATLHPLARDYLKRLKKAAANLPRARRKELIEEIESHLSEALPAGASETEARNVLERLGEPAEIVAEAGAGQALAPRAGLNEWLAIPFLLIGGVIIPVLGWFIGVVLLWSSRIWTVRDKLIGTLVIPAGLATTVFLLLGVGTVSGESCSSKTVTTVGSRTVKTLSANSDCVTSGGGANYLAIALAVLLVLLPVFTSIYLGRRLTRTNTAE